MIRIEFEEKTNKAIAYDEEKVIGLCEYIINCEEWNIVHTEVDDNYQGQGIAKKLVNRIIEEANKKQKKLTAECSYAHKIINKGCDNNESFRN